MAKMAADDGEGGGAAATAAGAAYRILRRWWTDRTPPLQALPAPTSFEFQASQVGWWCLRLCGKRYCSVSLMVPCCP